MKKIIMTERELKEMIDSAESFRGDWFKRTVINMLILILLSTLGILEIEER